MATLPNPNLAPPVFAIVNNEHQVPEVYHKEYIKGETPTAKLLRDLLSTVANTFGMLNAKRHNLCSNYEAEARDGLGTINGSIRKARTIADAEVKSYEDRLIDKANFKPNAANDGFIVGTFQAMRPEQRVEAIGKLVEQGDGPSLATLHKVSDVFTGLSPDVRATIKTRLYSHVDPAGYSALKQAEANRERIIKAEVAYTYEAPKFAAPLYRVKPASPESFKSVGG